MANVFLSYARKDGAKARTIADALHKAGHSVWWDRDIKGGTQFSKEIEEALERADAVVVLWSTASIESAWVRDEAAIGRDSNRLVPVRLDQSPPPLGFRQYQTIDLCDGRIRSDSPAMRGLSEAIDVVAAGSDGAIGPSERLLASDILPGPAWLTRRGVAVGLFAAGTAAGIGFLLLRDRSPPVSPEVAALMDQAWQAWTQGTTEGNSQAIGLYRRATRLAPDNADAWGFLGCAYGDRAHGAPSAERSVLRERAREAGRRALQLDPKNAYGRAAVAYARPVMGNWLPMEQAFRQGIRDQPDKWLVSYSLALLMTRVGRVSEAAAQFDRLSGTAPTATRYYFHIQSLWASGQLDEAERLLEEATTIFATHPVVWQTRFAMLLNSGRAGTAVALVQDKATRPSAISEEDLNDRLAVAQAMVSRAPAEINAVVATQLRRARTSAFRAQEAIQYAAALNRLEEAFTIADAYYFSRGFVIPDGSPSSARAKDVTLDSRETHFLFLPPLRAMRTDPRFEELVNAIGLARYWRNAGAEPDYRRS